MADLFGKAAAPTFNAPLEMLRACHGRIMDQCATLQKLLQHLPRHGNDIQAQQAALAILRYFDTAGQFHHQDEEIDLFPLLLATGNAEAATLIKRLLDDHKIMHEAWQNLRSRLQHIADGELAKLEVDVVNVFSKAYENHITLENAQLLPLAAQLLSSQQKQELGVNMATRRGVKI